MKHMPSSDDDRPSFDTAFAAELVGKYVLIGITVESKSGEFKRQEQFHGMVEIADPDRGIKIALRGVREGQDKWLPPATHVFEVAAKGVYTLHETGESVEDPDFIVTWLLQQPDA